MNFERFLRGEQHQYISSMRPILSKKALFSDTTENFISPAEPAPYSEVTITFRAKKNNLDRVFFICQGQKNLMFKASSDSLFDYYEHRQQLDNEKITYYFEAQSGKARCYYDSRGVVKQPEEHYYFSIIPGFSTPAWAKGAVMYQIYVDRFCNGDPTNDVLTGEYHYIGDKSRKVEDWYAYPAQMDVRNFYGGDLQGVLDKMDYLQDLGIDVIYFNPLFVSPSNHKYDIQDYDYIDPHVGKIVSEEGELLPDWQHENRFAGRYINRVTNKENLEASNQLFIKVVEEAHRRGMRVIIDGVFNHCGSFNKWLDRERIYEGREGYAKGAFIDRDSPYHDYFMFHDEYRVPYNPTYDGWWGHDTLPKLNYEGSRELYEYIMRVAAKWVSPPFNADGWRLDVAADLGHSPDFNHRFWRDFRRSVKSANPNAIILAEHYGDPSSWLQGDQWDTVMNYDAFMEPVTWFLTGMQKHSDDYRQDLLGNAESFWGAMGYHSACFATPSIQVAMNELSNHDHSRFLTRTNKKVGRMNTLGPDAANQGVNKAVMREAVLIQMTWPGAPTIYYGDEAGLCGFTDPDNRRTYPWGREDQELIAYHKAAIKVHKENQEFKTGSIKWMLTDYNMIGYARFTRDNHSLILINNNDHEMTKELSVWELGIPKEAEMTRLLLTGNDGFYTDPVKYVVEAGKITVTLPPVSGIILQHRNEPVKRSEEMKSNRKNFLQFL
ncbi:glycoside hydrolase family 13 protein [Eisenbergiella porci]|uniref:glycoside hydrolase family 13 protein n=1 Tax=Eisenbergiella porci TaxID=2652274 RepID=UPI002A8258FA|nr:glycoside hydrolase family 13 protein [Eisenbergiella porci]